MARRVAYDEGITLRFILLHPAIWFLFATIGVVYLSTIFWTRHKERFLVGDKFKVSSENVKWSEHPSWADQLLTAPKNRIANSNQSLLDTELVPEVHGYLNGFPWIRHIDKIEKTTNGLSIDLDLRLPVALLGEQGSVIVDGDGIVFDKSIFNSMDLARTIETAIRINMPQLDVRPSVAWHKRSDPRIAHAARLAEFLDGVKQELGVYRVITEAKFLDETDPDLQFWTANGTRIFWGRAPGFESLDEATADAKLAAVRKFVENYGKLSSFEHRKSHIVDVSSGQPQLVKDDRDRFAQKNDWLDEIK